MTQRKPVKQFNTVAIVGVGLIGGSIGIDLLAGGLAREVVGIGRHRERLRVAKEKGAVTRSTLQLVKGVAQAELVVVCTPVGRIVEDVRAAAAACPPGALITDTGSTKQSIVSALAQGLPNDVHFVGSHPLAGSEKSGPAAAVPGLFEHRVVVVTPTEATRPQDYRAIHALWTQLGARVIKMSAEQHDRALAATSHLPHLAASVLAVATPEEHLPLVAGGWLDSTRVAGAEAALWQQIVLDNRANVLTALARYEKVLASLRRAVELGDEAKLGQILQQARRRRETAQNSRAAVRKKR